MALERLRPGQGTAAGEHERERLVVLGLEPIGHAIAGRITRNCQ